MLQRLVIGADSGAAPGSYSLVLSHAGHLNPESMAYAPSALNGAEIRIDEFCPMADSDDDGVYDIDEAACGGDPYDPQTRPERIDGQFAGVDDDGDTVVDEGLPAGSENYDCDGDGYKGSAEDHVYSYVSQIDGDQKTCGEPDTNFPDPTQPSNPSFRWPADLVSTGMSANRIDVQDLVSFLAPIYYLNTMEGTNPGDVRWDLVPGPGGLGSYDINVLDLNSVNIVAPPMLGGVRAYGGPPCPWPP